LAIKDLHLIDRICIVMIFRKCNVVKDKTFYREMTGEACGVPVRDSSLTVPHEVLTPAVFSSMIYSILQLNPCVIQGDS